MIRAAGAKLWAMVLALAGVMAMVHGDQCGAIKVKSAQEVAQKWADQTPGRQAYYESGVKGAGQDWENNTAAAAANFKAAIQASNIDKMFAGGVRNAGAEKYTRKAGTVGSQRFGQGVTAAVGDMAKGIDPMLQTISGLTLPARAPRGSAANLQRVAAVAQALHAKRLALRAAGS